uniref:NLR family CARD domain containing 3 n=1 Tax=Takifugu rubripes TaxID=31033 RepID=A0A674NTL6_TAKRU
MLTHLIKVDVLSLAEKIKIKEASALSDQVSALIGAASVKEKGSAVLLSFIKASDSQAAQLILHHGKMSVLPSRVYVGEITFELQYLFLSFVLIDRDFVSCPKLNISSRTLLLVDGLSDLQQKEHDLMQVGVIQGRKPNHLRQLVLDKLLEPLTRVSLPPRVSLTVGVAGIGKTTWVRHFVRQWSQGAICPDISFVLPFTFCELNLLDKMSAERLVKIAFPHMVDASLFLNSSCRTLLIFDGLDEFNGTLNFSDVAPCSDPKKEVPIDELITNIIRGNLLPDVAVWVTSRPGVASLIPGGLVDRVTEIPGLSSTDIQLFLKHHFSEREVDKKIWAHLESHKMLMVMCSIPCICWILAETLTYIIQSETHESLPKTCTELYAQFCSMKAEIGEPRGREPPKMEHGSNRKLLGNLGRLAFYGLLKRKYTFSEQDLKAYGIDSLLTQCSLGAGVVVREESFIHTTYRFTHLTIQEFLAATFYHASSKRAIFDLFSENTMSWPKIGFQNHFKCAFQHSQQAEDGHLDVFVRFLAGLLSPVTLKTLAGLLAVGKDDGNHKTWASGFLQGILGSGGAVVSLRTVNLAYCLQELQHSELLRSVEEDLRLGSLTGKLTRAHCVVLGYLLHVSAECSKETNLPGCLNYSTVKCLLPQLLYCSHLRLESNNFKDDVMELLGSLLSAKDCQIQKMSLAENAISNKGAKALSRALLVNRTLTSLNLRNNNIGSKGARFLAEALKMNQALVSLNLQSNGIDEAGAEALAEVLQCNRKLASSEETQWSKIMFFFNLTTLCWKEGDFITDKMSVISDASLFNSLQWNFIKSSATKALAHSLHFNTTMELLDLQENAVGNEGVTFLADALKANTSLRTLCLQGVSVGTGGAIALAEALMSNQTLQTLDLRGNSVGMEGAKALANALKTNRSLKSLNLQENSLGMDGAIFIATAFKENHQLTYINLQGNGIGESGAKVISDTIRGNTPGCVVDI